MIGLLISHFHGKIYIFMDYLWIQIFGYSIEELEEKTGHYILVNQVVLPENLIPERKKVSENDNILFLVLSAIYLSDGQLVEGDYKLSSISLNFYKSNDDKTSPESLMKHNEILHFFFLNYSKSFSLI